MNKDKIAYNQAIVDEVKDRETSPMKRGGRYHCVLEIPNDCVQEVHRESHAVQLDLTLPLGGELDMSQLIKQINELELTRAEKDGLIEEIHEKIDQTVVGAFLRRFIRFDNK